eukprot:TRINITY_DN17091_c0_g1_i3.p1 TRINITY_DN17091_c0_g1~~TRINITY_DN17091_c0_g1_i3.p1  ORF type:complete len:248 (-),score=24.21 TRINITY_DN17091_c0_g1_i3:56-799(-)
MKMTPKIQSFVMHFGEMGSRWGVNRTVGQLFALLVLSEKPLNADDLGSALSISRGNVSMGLKELQSWRLVKPIHVPGDRKEYYAAVGDIWEMGTKIVEERRKREIDPTLSVLRDLLLEAPANEADFYAHDKMEEIHDLMEMVANWTSDLQHLNHDKLKTLMKLGSGVGKVLDIKDKLLSKKNETKSPKAEQILPLDNNKKITAGRNEFQFRLRGHNVRHAAAFADSVCREHQLETKKERKKGSPIPE